MVFSEIYLAAMEPPRTAMTVATAWPKKAPMATPAKIAWHFHADSLSNVEQLNLHPLAQKFSMIQKSHVKTPWALPHLIASNNSEETS